MDPSTYVVADPRDLRLVRFTIVPQLMTLSRDSVYPFSAIGVASIRRRSARNMKELVVMGRLLWCRLVPPVTHIFLRTKHTTICPAFLTKTSTWSDRQTDHSAMSSFSCWKTFSVLANQFTASCILFRWQVFRWHVSSVFRWHIFWFWWQVVQPCFSFYHFPIIIMLVLLLLMNVPSAKWSSFVTQWAYLLLLEGDTIVCPLFERCNDYSVLSRWVNPMHVIWL